MCIGNFDLKFTCFMEFENLQKNKQIVNLKKKFFVEQNNKKLNKTLKIIGLIKCPFLRSTFFNTTKHLGSIFFSIYSRLQHIPDFLQVVFLVLCKKWNLLQL